MVAFALGLLVFGSRCLFFPEGVALRGLSPGDPRHRLHVRVAGAIAYAMAGVLLLALYRGGPE